MSRVLITRLKETTMRQIFPTLGLLFLSVLPGHAEEDVHIIDRVQADRFLQSGAVFIDNRPESKFSIGHIEGAINLPFFVENDRSNKMTRENLATAIGDKEIVVFYCTGHERAYHAIKQAKR